MSKIRKPDWGPGAGRPLVGCKGNALLGCPRGNAPRKLKDFVILNSFKWPLLVYNYSIKAWVTEQNFQNLKLLWGPGASKPLVGCKGNTLLCCLRGKAQKLKIFPFIKTLKRPILEDKYKKRTFKQAQLKC